MLLSLISYIFLINLKASCLWKNKEKAIMFSSILFPHTLSSIKLHFYFFQEILTSGLLLFFSLIIYYFLKYFLFKNILK